MASTYSTNLKIELMATGSDSGTWGTNTNTNLGTAIEQAIIGYGNPDYTSDANLTITITNSSASQAARCLVLNVTSAFGSLTATRELIVPTIQKQYIVQNNTTGGQSITVKTSAGTGITVPTGRKAHLYVDGTNVIQMFDFVDINGGTIDGTTVGAASASTGAFTTLNASGATTLDGTVALGNASGDLITVPGTVGSNLIFTDNTFDIGASGATRPRNLFLAGAATVAGNLSVGGTLTLTGGVNLNGNVTVGDSSADTLTINSTITSNLIFTDNTYDIGASGATRPRNLFLAGNITAAGNQTLAGALTVDSTTDSTSTTTGSIQTDGGVGVAKALFVGTTVSIAGVATFSAGTAALPALTTTGDTNTGIFFPAADTIAFTEGGAESMRIDSSGRLGIGNTSPSNLLDVGSSTTASTVKIVSTSNGSNVAAVQANCFGQSALGLFANNSGSTQDGVPTGTVGLGTAGSVALVLTTGGSERCRIDTSGNVGIATTAGKGKLSVKTADATSVATIAGSTWDATYSLFGVPDTTNGSCLGIGMKTGGVTAGFGTILLSIAPNSDYLPINYHGNIHVFYNGASEKMRLDASGNLGVSITPAGWVTFKAVELTGGAIAGIGTNQFDVVQNAYYDGAFKYKTTYGATFYQQAGSVHAWYNAPSGTANAAITFTQAMTLDASGNLGVGTASPSARLHAVVDGAGESDIARFSRTNGADLHFLDIGVNADTNFVIFDSSGSTAGGYTFRRGGTDAMTLDASGNLFIGGTSTTAIPTLNRYVSLQSQANNDIVGYALYVNEGVNSRRGSLFLDDNAGVFGLDVTAGSGVPDIVFRTAGTEHVRILSSNGNVGIGTSSPSARFDVRRGDADGLIAEFHQSGGYGIDVGSSQSVAYLSSGYLQAFTFKTDGGSGQVERARIDSNGNLLVGTTSASGIITTSTSVNSQAGSIFTRNTNASAGSYSGLTVGNDISNNKAGYILTSSNQPLSGFFGPSSIYAYASSGLIAIVTETANPIIFGTSGSERARIDSSGNLYLGGTTQYNSAKFTISYSGSANNGLAFIDTVDQTGTGYLSFHNSAGTQIGSVTRVTTTNAVVYNTTSDYRLKTVTGAVTGQGARIDALKPVDYTWTEGGQQARGFLAHEFQAVYSNSVTGVKDAVDADGNPVYQTMQASTSEVIADLVAEIQSLRQRLSAANL